MGNVTTRSRGEGGGWGCEVAPQRTIREVIRWRLGARRKRERERERKKRKEEGKKWKRVNLDEKRFARIESWLCRGTKIFSLSRRGGTRRRGLCAARCSAVRVAGGRRPCSGLRRNSSTPRHQQVTRRGVAKSSVAARRVRAIKALRDRESYERVVASTRKL